MRKAIAAVLTGLLAAGCASAQAPAGQQHAAAPAGKDALDVVVQPAGDYPIRAVPFTAVQVDDAFWSPRLEINRKVTIPYAFKKCEETGRIENFVVAARRLAAAGKANEDPAAGKAGTKAAGRADAKAMPGAGQKAEEAAGGSTEQGSQAKVDGFQGIFFNDSDVYKVIEGAAYALAMHPDPQLEQYCDGVIAKIAAAQEPDGYLYTARTIMDAKHPPPGGKERWSDVAQGHELYCVGHMYEAAVAYAAATGKRQLLEVAIKNADLVASVFGPGRKPHPCGHPEIEIGLVRLYRATGERKYLELAKFFIDTRGRADGRALYGEYAQDHKPLVEQTEVVGHAVRAAYLYAGMADVAALTGGRDGAGSLGGQREDAAPTGARAYVAALDRLWQDLVGTKLYLTGGIGAHGSNEGFGAGYELPNASAYNETCAAIANALWQQRLWLTHGDAKYVDVLERVIYNGFLSGWSLGGDRFFYPNPLESRGAERAEWFGCACCPPNVVRFVPSIAGYIYAHRGHELYVNLFIGSETKVPLAGTDVHVRQRTRYPWTGEVEIIVSPATPGRFVLRVRIPGWARGEVVPGDLYRFADECAERAVLKVNGALVEMKLDGGYAVLDREWKSGDKVALSLPMPVRRVAAHAKVQADAGRVALQRGPLVYCFEGVDQPEGRDPRAMLLEGAEFGAAYRGDLLNGVMTLTGKARLVNRGADGGVRRGAEFAAVAIPYYAWANRGRTPMAVWIAGEAEVAARPAEAEKATEP
ncbi:MAG: beta-L-arabinofuranosidase domain-containing protein [Planctomycetota bacterium]